MKYISVCSGIEAATVAWHELGFEPVAFSEIEKFPSAVLSHHYPEVPNWGDMTKFKEWPDATIDLLVGGTPCQSFSVAGLRKGLDDPRGNLMLTYLAIADRYRPKWILWENVPGVLSSNRGRDFGTFLGALGELGYGWSYRVLDAQYFGVAQRRRRVFVVGYFGDWRSAAAVLLERESMSGNPPPSRKARKDVASGIGSGGKEFSQSVEQKSIEVVGSLDTECRGTKLNHQTAQNGHLVCASRMVAFGEYVNDETASAMKARDWKDATDLILISEYVGNAEGGAREVPFLTCHNTGGTAGISNQTPLVLQSDVSVSQTIGSLCARDYKGVGSQYVDEGKTIPIGMAVRRLTPVECERLQGFPDGYTDIRPKDKDTPDGPRYKALGNSMAVPVMRWIGRRIKKVEEIKKLINQGERNE